MCRPDLGEASISDLRVTKGYPEERCLSKDPKDE